MKHYTYLITYPDGQVYHGVRSCDGIIENDSYMGSSQHTPKVGTKTVLTTHATRKEALAEEIRYHAEHNVKSNKNYHNRSNATTTMFDYDNTGIPHSDKSKAQTSKALMGIKFSEERKNSMTGNVNRSDKAIYRFVHKVHGAVSCTTRELYKRFNLNPQGTGQMKNGISKHHKGWQRAD